MRRALAVLLPLVAVLLVAIWRSHGVAPKGAAAPDRDFSAARAIQVLRTIHDGASHPIGTEANARMRERIVERFRALGYETTIQTRFACHASASCGLVSNIIARPPGGSRRDVVLLVAHYDSVPAGPGASDDAAGVAALLEIARAIRGETFRNDVAFLIDDGEEAGLLGAEAFAADSSLLDPIAVVLNVEARGTFGPSTMFETSRGNRWLIRHLAGALDVPQSSSLFYTIYDQLPNDTDVTVFKRAGLAAVNFGIIRGVQWYHTPLDDLAHVSPRALQHQGDNLLASLRTFANTDLDARSSSDATWFDVLGFGLAWWPQEWTLWIAGASLVLLLVGARRSVPRAMTFGVLATFLTFILTIPAAIGIARLARLRSMDINFVADPRPSTIAMWLTGIACALAAYALLNRRDDAQAMILGTAIVWHAIAIALALTLPGAAFLFLVPALAMSIAAALKGNELWIVLAGATSAAILMFPIGLILYEALGGSLMIAVAVVMAAFATTVAPLFARWRYAAVAAAGAIVFAAIALLQPAFNIERPKHVALSFIDDPAATTPLWSTRSVSDRMRDVASFRRDTRPLLPGVKNEWTAAAPRLPIARVTLDATRTAGGARVRVRSNRGAGRVALLVRGGTVRSVNGVVPPPRPARYRSRLPQGWSTAIGSGVDKIVVEIIAKGQIELIASDTSFGLPKEGAALARARDASNATPVHEGDVTITRARASL